MPACTHLSEKMTFSLAHYLLTYNLYFPMASLANELALETAPLITLLLPGRLRLFGLQYILN